jgi:CTP synthase (UTP-ammonia lyase)
MPLCCPSRTSILRGQYSHTTGIFTNGGYPPFHDSGQENATIATWLHDAGYRTGLVGKYINLPDAYLSVAEALRHGGYACGARVQIDWIASDDTEGLLAEGRLRDLDGIVIPGGFGFRGIEGKIAAAGFARLQDVPFLGLCLGLHCATIEFARDACGLAGANSSEFDQHSPHPVIDLMDEQRNVVGDLQQGYELGANPSLEELLLQLQVSVTPRDESGR